MDEPTGPPLLKPLPRRPNKQRHPILGLGLDDNAFDSLSSNNGHGISGSSHIPPTAPLESPSLLADSSSPSDHMLSPMSSTFGSKSRSRSIVNLTSGALFGIYGPAHMTEPNTDPSSPHGEGGETPLTPLSSSGSGMSLPYANNHEGGYGRADGPPEVAGAGYLEARRRPPTGLEISKRLREKQIFAEDNSSRRSSANGATHDHSSETEEPPTRSPFASTTSWTRITSRSILLFMVGVAYGGLVAILPVHGDAATFGAYCERAVRERRTFVYLSAWGAAGVVLGTILPVVDRVVLARRRQARSSSSHTSSRRNSHERKKRSQRAGDHARPRRASQAHGRRARQPSPASLLEEWSSVVRSVGAFVGIAFAIRKLQWETTLQLSATLALTNPFLWYLVDRTSAGLAVATAVAALGSSAILAFGGSGAIPVPVPAGMSSVGGAGMFGRDPAGGATGQTTATTTAATTMNGSLKSMTRDDAGLLLSGSGVLASTVGLGDVVWVASVLFWSSVCFGAIGRLMRSK